MLPLAGWAALGVTPVVQVVLGAQHPAGLVQWDETLALGLAGLSCRFPADRSVRTVAVAAACQPSGS